MNNDFVYFHEDYYCQIQLLPKENEPFCLSQMGEIEYFAEEHKDGIGYTDIYVRSNVKKPLSDYSIKKCEVERILCDQLIRYEKVRTGYSSYSEEMKSTLGFGFQNFTLFLEFDQDDIVQEMWIAGFSKSSEEINRMFRALKSIGDAWDLIIADWEGGNLVHLRDSESLESFCSSFYFSAAEDKRKRY